LSRSIRLSCRVSDCSLSGRRKPHVFHRSYDEVKRSVGHIGEAVPSPLVPGRLMTVVRLFLLTHACSIRQLRSPILSDESGCCGLSLHTTPALLSSFLFPIVMSATTWKRKEPPRRRPDVLKFCFFFFFSFLLALGLF